MGRNPPSAIASLDAAIANVPIPMAIVDAISRRFVAANGAFDELLAARGETMKGRDFSELLPLDVRRGALENYEAIVKGTLDGYQAQRRLIGPAGVEISGEIWVRRLQVDTARALTAAIFLPLQAGELPPSQQAIFSSDLSEVAFLVTDHDWTIEYASRDVETVIGGSPEQLVGKPLLGAVHPAVASDFLLSITRATTTRHAVLAQVQMRGDSQWRSCICLITALCDHSPPKLGLAIVSIKSDSPGPDVSRTKQLEQHLLRIAAEVMAARLLPRVDDTSAIDKTSELAELTSHQFEITMRLLNGERVPQIARAIHLSPSTVRNHLSAVFRRFGVHSQGELISVLKGLPESGWKTPAPPPLRTNKD